MRLVDTATTRLHDFSPGDVPPYAILSHTWGLGELTYQDMIAPEIPTEKPGFQKISQCCKEARLMKQSYVWIDTCSIDKTNHVELSEAINSMYRWYEEAEVCLVYLSDVHTIAADDQKFQLPDSRWLRRGWTLQELLAPNLKVFFNSTWHRIGYSRKTWDPAAVYPRASSVHPLLEYLPPRLSDVTESLVELTGIPSAMLLGDDLRKYSIAAKMSWAANRQTTRIEDEAYCLLGIFGVNMPLLYGEGSRAFVRLQDEILKASDDQSIFAHIAPREEALSASPLALSSSYFRLSGDIGEFRKGGAQAHDTVARTKKGLQLRCQYCPSSRTQARIVLLECTVGRSSIARPALILEPLGGRYVRSRPSLLLILTSDANGNCVVSWRGRMDYETYTNVIKPVSFANIRDEIMELVPRSTGELMRATLPSIHLDELPPDLELASVEPRSRWDKDQKTFAPAYGAVGAQVLFEVRTHQWQCMYLIVGLEVLENSEAQSPIIEPWCSTEIAPIIKCFQDYLYDLPWEVMGVPENPWKAKSKRIAMRPGPMVADQWTATVESVTLMGRQEIVLRIEKIPQSDQPPTVISSDAVKDENMASTTSSNEESPDREGMPFVSLDEQADQL